MALSFKEVTEILRIIDASNCEEVVLEIEGTRLVVRRGGASPGAVSTVRGESAVSRTVDAGNSSDSKALAAAAPAGGLKDGQTPVRSPMVGTFYRAAEPGKPPFVEAGAAVRKGDPLCLIEVMKLFTTIESPADGTIDSILVENGEMVEFDQLLFALAPA